jgi:hypothetical protein
MLELSIMCVIALAGAYWMALFLMGRREDVLHGDFIRTAQPPNPNLEQKPTPRPSLPLPPLEPRHPAPAQAVPAEPVKPPEPVRQGFSVKQQAIKLERSEPAVLVKTIDPVQPVEPALRGAPVRSLVATQSADIRPKPEPPKPADATAPAWRRPQPPEPARPDILQSLLETIKRDLGDAVSR